MNIITTIPDESIPAWEYRVDQFNSGRSNPPVDIQGFSQINRDIETNANVAAFNSYQLQQLVPLGERYNAAPESVKLQIDALLSPYN